MQSLNDIVLQIHMTFLSNKDSIGWITSFKDEISPLSYQEFQNLVNMLEGVSEAEHANFTETLNSNAMPAHLKARAESTLNFDALIQQLKIEYTLWNS